MNIKKILTSITALIIFSAILSVGEISSMEHYNVSAEVLTTGSIGENVTYSFDTETDILTISGTGDMQDFSLGESPFFKNMSDNNIKTVIIEEGITSIGNAVFSNIQSIENVVLPDSITSIGELSFNACTSLKSIDIPKSVTSIGNMAFFWCKSLKSVNIPNGIATIESSTFGTCIELERITIPNTVTSIDYGAFKDCNKLKSVIIPSSVTTIKKYALGFEGSGDTLEKITDFTIYGVVGSTAEKYAIENDFNFISIDENNPPNIYEEVSVIDILSLKKYILNINSDVENIQSIDYNSDNMINILDLTLAKSKIIYK